MSDLSWLNPTPHTIAVYASSPLSPAATQHSLPSGRYPLLGPDFHRLDRTSLRLAHSLEHLVGAAEYRNGHADIERLGSLEVDVQFDFGCLLNRQLGWLVTFQNPTNIDSDEAMSLRNARSVTHQASGSSELAQLVDRRHCVANRQRGELTAVT